MSKQVIMPGKIILTKKTEKDMKKRIINMENREPSRLSQCLLCKLIQSDQDGVFTSDGELICEECCDWLNREKESIE